MNKHQSAFTLIIALIILATLAVLGIAVMSSSVSSQKVANISQQDAVVFHAAQTANSSYIAAYQYDINHLLDTAKNAFWDDLTKPRTGYGRCVNSKGELVTCTASIALESDALVKAEVEAFYHDCETAALKCLGNSWDNTGLGCHSFQLVGQGHLDLDQDGNIDQSEANTHIEEWVNVVRSCNKTL